MKDSVRRRLEQAVERFEEVGRMLADPEVIGRPDRFRDLSMEYSRLEPVATRFDAFRGLEAERAAALEMSRGADAEMRELALEELRALEARFEARVLDGKVLEAARLADHVGVGEQRADFLESLDGLLEPSPDRVLHQSRSRW